MDGLLEKVRDFVAANGLFVPGDRIGVAVSGGIDSVVLLHVLRGLTDLGLALTVCHVDHGLRPESSGEADFVRSLAAGWGLPFVGVRLEVRDLARARRISLEMAARELRYEALSRIAAEHGLARVALGHHRDDQVETILLRLLRGTGLDGLSAMAASRDGGRFVRPLLSATRREIRSYALENGLSWVEDASNQCLDMLRNRIRHHLLPMLRAEYNPGIDRALLGLSRLARETQAHLDGELTALWPGLEVRLEKGGCSFAKSDVAALPRPLGQAAVRRMLATIGGDPGRLSLAATLRIWEFIQGRGGPRLSVPGGFTLARRGERFFLGRVSAAPGLAQAELPVPGRLVLPDGRILTCQWWDGNLPAWADVSPDEAFVDGAVLVLPLLVRSRRPGDRMRPLGLAASTKIKEILIAAKVPREERDAVPLVVDGEGRVVWLAGLRLDHRFRITGSTEKVLHLAISAPSSPGLAPVGIAKAESE